VSNAVNQATSGPNNPIKNPFQTATHFQERTHPSILTQSNRGKHTLKKRTKKKIILRRITQHRAKRYKRNVDKESSPHLQQQTYHIRQSCLRNFGFYANQKFSLQKNFNDTIKNEPNFLLPQPLNLTFHNLCKNKKVPQGTKQLLGLNLKYCLASSQLKNNINTTVQKMAYAIRTTFHLQNSNLTKDSDYIKQIYIRNRNWHPDPAAIHIENNITTFEKNLKEHQNEQTYKLQNRNLRNLTHTQSLALRQLKQDENLTIKPTDKNLGPAIVETETYVKQILKEHLLTKDCQRLSEATAKNRLTDIKHTLKSVIDNNQDLLSKAELTYFQRSFKCHHRIPIFYGLPKVHKTPMTVRPVVSSSSSFLSIFSVWLDHKMKTRIPLVQSYIQNSIAVANDLKSLEIPEGALIFSADATLMYTNIDTETGVSAIRNFIATNLRYLPQDFPTELFLQILNIVMENNIFTFAGTYWLQLSGTAMGTPAA
jgi:hypothetical protein